MRTCPSTFFFFFFNDTATTEIYPLSLHDALPIYDADAWLDLHHQMPLVRRHETDLAPEAAGLFLTELPAATRHAEDARSEEHTSELQSPCNLVCRLLLEKKNTNSDSCSPDTPSER